MINLAFILGISNLFPLCAITISHSSSSCHNLETILLSSSASISFEVNTSEYILSSFNHFADHEIINHSDIVCSK